VRVAEELFLSDLKPDMVIGLEAPEPLYLAAVVEKIMFRCVELRATLSRFRTIQELLQAREHFGPPFRLHANRTGEFVNEQDQQVRVFRMVETTA
jgi:hypothetical protein